MNLLNFIFKKSQLRVDRFLGKMVYMPIGKEVGYFECMPVWEATGRPIEVAVTADKNTGPTSEQQKFFLQIQKDYAVWTVKTIPLIENALKYVDQAFKIRQFSSEFDITYLSIPVIKEGEPVQWSASFSTIHDYNHEIEITMLDFRPQHIQIDG